MAKNLIILSLFAALLLFGCLGAGEVTEEEKETPAGDGAPPTGDGAPPTEDGDGAPPTEDGDGIIDFAGLDYAAVMTLGVPVQCDITVIQDGETMNVKLYAKGENEIRQEFASGELEEECTKFIWINRDYNVYIGCEGGNYPPDTSCNWFLLATAAPEEEPEDMGVPVTYESPELGDVPSTQISCMPWLYDASKFQTPGKVCTLEDIMEEFTGGAYDYDY